MANLPRSVDLSPRALLAAGVTGALAADLGAAETGRWTLAARAEDLAPGTNGQAGPAQAPISIVKIRGPIDQRSAMQDPCGGVTDGYDTIEARFAAAVQTVAKAGKGEVQMHFDSPGGMTSSMVSTARRMRSLADQAGVKVSAVADERMCSAAFCLALVADKGRINVPKNGRTASIGVVMVRKPAADAQGIEIFRSGERKMRPNSIEPLDAQDRLDIQEMVDAQALEFAEFAAERRGMSVESIQALKGAAMSGEAALAAGLIDGLKNAREVIDMATEEAARASAAEAAGLPASASWDEINGKIKASVAALGELTAAKEALAKQAAEKLAQDAKLAQDKLLAEKASARATFAAEVKEACSVARVITPVTEAGLLAHYDAHGEASARSAFAMARSAAPLVQTGKVGVVASGTDAGTLSAFDKQRAKDLGLTEAQYAADYLGQKAGGS